MHRPVSRRALLAFAAAAAPGVAAGCGHELSFTDPVQPISVRVGARFQIQLAANATTGYFWQQSGPLPPVVRLLSSRYIASPHAPHLVGSGGTSVWSFRAVSRGSGTIALKYARSDGVAARTAAFSIQVR